MNKKTVLNLDPHQDVVIIRFMDEYDFEIDDLVSSVAKQVPFCP